MSKRFQRRHKDLNKHEIFAEFTAKCAEEKMRLESVDSYTTRIEEAKEAARNLDTSIEFSKSSLLLAKKQRPRSDEVRAKQIIDGLITVIDQLKEARKWEYNIIKEWEKEKTRALNLIRDTQPEIHALQKKLDSFPKIREECSDGTVFLSDTILGLVFSLLFDLQSEHLLGTAKCFRACSVGFREATRVYLHNYPEVYPKITILPTCTRVYTKWNFRGPVRDLVLSYHEHLYHSDMTWIQIPSDVIDPDSYHVALYPIMGAEGELALLIQNTRSDTYFVGGKMTPEQQIKWDSFPLTPVNIDSAFWKTHNPNCDVYNKPNFNFTEGNQMRTLTLSMTQGPVELEGSYCVNAALDLSVPCIRVIND